MALLDNLFKKTYTAMVYCNNCCSHSEVKIPKGVTVFQFIETGACPSCGCSVLVADYKQIDEFKNQPKPQVKLLRVGRRSQQIEPLQRASLPQPRPSNRPANLPPPKRRESVPEPDFTPKGIFKNDVDFWTGRPKKRREENREDVEEKGDEYENY